MGAEEEEGGGDEARNIDGLEGEHDREGREKEYAQKVDPGTEPITKI